MPRPLAVFGTTFFIGLIFINFVGIEYSWYFTASVIVSLVLLLIFKRVRKSPVFISAIFALLLACFSMVFAYEFSLKPALLATNIEGNSVVIGKVSSIGTNSEGKTYCLVRGRFINGKRLNYGIRLNFEKSPEFELHDSISFDTKLLSVQSMENSVRRNYLSKGIYFVVRGDTAEYNVLHKGSVYHPMRIVATLRSKLVYKITDALPGENGALLVGLLFGDTSLLSKSTLEEFRTIGASHLVAVSGLHFSVFLHSIALLFDKLRFGKKISTALMLSFLIFFMAITAFTPSVLRAGFMFLLTLLGRLLLRKPDSLNSLGFAVILICLFSPLKAASIGLQLSFFATMGIVLANSYYDRRVRTKISKIKNVFLAKLSGFLIQSFLFSVFASALTLPSLMLSFGFVSLASVLSNILLAEFAGPTLILGALAALFALNESLLFLSNPLFFLAGLCSKYMLWVSEKLSGFSFSLISLKQKYVFIWLAFAFLLLAYSLLVMRKGKRNIFKTAIVLLLALFLTGSAFDFAFNKDTVAVRVFESRDQNYVILNYKRKAAVLCCGGNSYTASKVKNTFRDFRIKDLDLLLLPGLEKNETGAAAYLLEEFSANRLIVSPKNPDRAFVAEFQDFEELSSYKARLWNKVDIYSNTIDDESYIYFDISGTKFLILNSYENDLLPTADIIICKTLPEKFKLYKNNATLVITSKKPIKEEVYKQLKNKKVFIYEIASEGDLVIKTSGNAAYKIERGT